MPTDLRSERRLIKVLTKMIKHYLETHREEFSGAQEISAPTSTMPPEKDRTEN